MKKLKFGVIGSARGMDISKVFKVLSEAALVSLFDLDKELGEKTAAGIPGCKAFHDYEKFVGSDIDVAIVASPVHYHVENAIALLENNIHVLSEVIAATDLRQAKQLVDTCNKSKAGYMMLENYRYLDDVELVKRLAKAGKFGTIHYAEGAYLHDCQDLYYDKKGALTWRGSYGNAGFYCSHSLGPILYILEDRITHVSALCQDAGMHDKKLNRKFNDLMQMKSEKGRHINVRVDSHSKRPHQMAYYGVQGSKGSYEADRGNGDRPKVWFEDNHEESHCAKGCDWHNLSDYEKEFIPDRLAISKEARDAGSHGTSEYWMMKEFIDDLLAGRPLAIDIHKAMDYCLPGIIGMESALKGGIQLEVPNSRDWV
jgi:predicted dehydrogenase